jgi:putative hydrolase of the HAD superfamily
MASLFRSAGVEDQAEELGINAAQLFRISSIEYVKLYPGALEALALLREKGCRLWLLSNAQRIFTEYELRHLGLGEQLDAIYISSDFRCRKPDARFYRALMQEQGLSLENCLMIGNDRFTDIGGARGIGMASLYMHTNLTPPDQREADPALHPTVAPGNEMEYEGYDWQELAQIILNL